VVGIVINTMTLGGLAMAIGQLVDDATLQATNLNPSGPAIGAPTKV
jgi:multidrug efflux pump subunit AcrB